MTKKAAPSEIRIVGGQWKRSKLPVLDAPGLRPTPDRVRETLFNWLMFQAGGSLVGWRVIDAFAGTGALGWEAASRGAQALLVEREAGLVAALHRVKERLQADHVQIRRADGVATLQSATPDSVDLVFLDPPFGGALLAPALAAAARCVRAAGFVYAESDAALDDAALHPLGLTALRHLKAGQVHAHLLQKMLQESTLP